MEVSTLMVGWGWSFEQLKAGWKEIEELGFDACYMGDDLFPHYFDDDVENAQSQVEVYDPWTILPIMADSTSRMRIGSLVSPAGRRHPALFAKMTSIVDTISKGRLTVSMGAGNSPDQRAALGEPNLSGMGRAARLEEEVRILDSLWKNERSSLEGQYYTVNKMVNYPKPVSKPRPEIQIAFKSKKFLTRLSAEFADRVNLIGGDDSIAQGALDALKSHCEDLGRDYNQIKKGRLCAIMFTDEEVGPDQLDRVLEERARQIGKKTEDMLDEHKDLVLSYVGPASGCVEALKKRTLDMGIDEIVMCPDTISENSYENTMKGLRFFAKEVMPGLKAL
ncbi:LLM class flavin-dependent oxidoreductase [Pseudomaricurvus alkylphenolicus]|uniref:LLM class flavin-dependent oxidoreductase n=1 Tax=Pseudomaricurvus alkylphenolicus TaxID=1306991 RepID=UPI00142338EC|nr:LLM class flavin-dependent oxidoreductase [Pseudomaricurvus alkylphenolicus]NIB38414.1 LLM class flavin-dependent oxidoreductase [Pseudomaricurvus alkylphenolicus]